MIKVIVQCMCGRKHTLANLDTVQCRCGAVVGVMQVDDGQYQPIHKTPTGYKLAGQKYPSAVVLEIA